jgi:hypothetical protein
MFTRRKLSFTLIAALLLIMLSATVASAQETMIGGTATVRDADALSDSLVIAFTGVPAPAAGTAFEGWLVKPNGDKISVGIPAVDGGGAIGQTFMSASGENLAAYSSFRITSEPVPDPDPATPGSLLYAETIASGVFLHIGHLLVSWPSNPDGKGIAVGLREQAGVAATHALLAQNSTTLASKQLHSHHVINIIEGTGGANYDGSFGDPGDGFGVINYALDTIKHAGFIKTAAPDDAVVVAAADAAIASANNAMADAILARDAALSVANRSTDDLIVDVGLANAVNATKRALEGSDENADGTLSGSEGGANTAYTASQDIGAFLPAAGDAPTTPVTGDTLVSMVALFALIAGLVLTAGGGLLVFRRRTAA